MIISIIWNISLTMTIEWKRCAISFSLFVSLFVGVRALKKTNDQVFPFLSFPFCSCQSVLNSQIIHLFIHHHLIFPLCSSLALSRSPSLYLFISVRNICFCFNVNQIASSYMKKKLVSIPFFRLLPFIHSSCGVFVYVFVFALLFSFVTSLWIRPRRKNTALYTAV